MHWPPRNAAALFALAAIAVPIGCSASPSATPAATPATPEPPAPPTISEVITPPRPSRPSPVPRESDAVRTQFRRVIEDLPLDTPTDAFEPAAETVVLEIHDRSSAGDTVRRVRLGPVIVDRTAIRYTVYRSDDGTEVQFALDPGTDGLDRFNAAAVSCVERSASCPTGRIAYIMDGDLVADPVVTGAPFADISILIADGVMAPAPPGSPFS